MRDDGEMWRMMIEFLIFFFTHAATTAIVRADSEA